MKRRVARLATKPVPLRTKLWTILLITVGFTAMFLIVFALAIPALLNAAYPNPDRLTGVNWAVSFSPAVQLVGIGAAGISVLLGISTAGRVIIIDWLSRRRRA